MARVNVRLVHPSRVLAHFHGSAELVGGQNSAYSAVLNHRAN